MKFIFKFLAGTLFLGVLVVAGWLTFQERSVSIRTSIHIHGSPETVWNVLTNFEEYPSWNPFMKSIQGDLTLGESLDVTVQSPGSTPTSFSPKIIAIERHTYFEWLGQFLVPGLFDGRHSFELVPQDDGTTLFIHKEQFSGWLVPFLASDLSTKTKTGFALMNQALKDTVEGKSE